MHINITASLPHWKFPVKTLDMIASMLWKEALVLRQTDEWLVSCLGRLSPDEYRHELHRALVLSDFISASIFSASAGRFMKLSSAT
jgi:hypothetical protein